MRRPTRLFDLLLPTIRYPSAADGRGAVFIVPGRLDP